jgi:hypothetical protein
VRLFSRNAYDWTERLAAIATAAESINAESFTIDGEVVVLGPDGLSRFEELSRREAARTAILRAFDLIEHEARIWAVARFLSAGESPGVSDPPNGSAPVMRAPSRFSRAEPDAGHIATVGRHGAHAASVVIRFARYDLQCVWMKHQIVPMAVGGIGVLDLPDVIVVIECDCAPLCETFVAQHGLDSGPLLGGRGPVCE